MSDLENEFEQSKDNLENETPVISRELAMMGRSGDEEPEENHDGKEEERQKKLRASAKGMCLDTLAAAESIALEFGKVNTGLTDEERQEWAEKVAPALVKMGITDKPKLIEEYLPYVTAAWATFSLGKAVMHNIAEQRAAIEGESEEVTTDDMQEEQAKDIATYQQDFTGKGGMVVDRGGMVQDGN